MLLGLFLITLGAACGGSFGLPSKFAGEDTPWETLWGPFFLFATILIPVTVFPWIAKGLFATAPAAGLVAVIGPFLFGMLWGLGSMTLGLSFAFIGLSLAYAINYGAQITFGTMLPMLIHNPGDALTRHGAVIMAGVVVCLVGVVVVGRAGILKSRSLEEEESKNEGKGPKMFSGLILAFVSGVLCACYAVAFSFGDGVMAVSTTQFANDGVGSAFAVTALILWGGAVSSCLFCAFKLTRNKTWNTLAKPGIGRVLLVALVMAFLHDGAILLFGVGAPKLGTLGVSVGYGVFMSVAIVVGNVNGFITGEWRGASRTSVRWIAAGIVILVLGVCVLAKGNAIKLSVG